MKRMILLTGLTMFLAGIVSAETVISYSYDKQYRLVETKYSEASKVVYAYDAANNLKFLMSILDPQKIQSFLLQISVQPSRSAPSAP